MHHHKNKKLNPKMGRTHSTAIDHKPINTLQPITMQADIDNTFYNSNNTTNNNPPIRVLRFEFSTALTEAVTAFAAVHRYDDRKTYRDAWMQWLAHGEIAALFKSEVARLTDLGYKGDVADKLFKSGRYYFRTREPTVQRSSLWPHTPPSLATSTPNDANGVADPKLLGVRGALVVPRKYVTMGRALLIAMDEHIERGLRSNDAYTPANGFSDFFKMHTNSDLLKTEVGNLMQHYANNENVPREIHAKLKKTYKNRYFMLVH